MKKLIVFLGLTVFAGCSPIVLKGGYNRIERVAFVSAYANACIYKLDDSTEYCSSMLDNLVIETVEGTNSVQDLVGSAVDYVDQSVAPELGWDMMPFDSVYAHPAFAAFQAFYTSDSFFGKLKRYMLEHERQQYVVARNTKWVPTDQLLSSPIFANREQEQLLSNMGKLARELGVDAVAVLSMDLAYSEDFMGSVLKAFTFGVFGHVKASVKADLILVDQHGNVVVRPSGLAKRYNSDQRAVLMLENFCFSNDSFMIFQEAVRKSLDGFRCSVLKAISER